MGADCHTAANATTYSDTGLTSGTNYFYRIVASNSVGNSGYSNDASATPAGNTVLNVFFIGGQSNANGYGVTIPASDRVAVSAK